MEIILIEMKNILVLNLLILLFGCNDTKKQEKILVPSNIPKNAIYPFIENVRDTIKNGNIFNSRLFLTNDSLFDIAKKNGIEEYLKIYVGFDKENYNNITFDELISVNKDTGRLKRKIIYDKFKKDTILTHYIGVKFDVNYIDNESEVDTSFINIDAIFVEDN